MAEVSVYVTATAQRQGVGSALLAQLIDLAEAASYWTLQGQVIASNQASHALLTRKGFREVGIRERYGHVDDVWHDVVLLERRSTLTGGPGLPTLSCGT
ncbi:MAG: GNAT family N-acetyltransferase [Alphaproteobacteria bacterium]|nr:GNAT family N-acetyltransferase [Alphaproteobacteria bacterium]